MNAPFTPGPARGWQIALITLAIAAHVLLALAAVRDKSLTVDEVAHLTGGYTFNTRHDYRFHPENGILPQRWQALPASLAGLNYPSYEETAWAISDVWAQSRLFLYQSDNPHDWVVLTGRAMNTVFGAGTLLLVVLWSRSLFGPVGVIPALAFAVFSPTLLAHGALATSDMAATFFLLAAVSAYGWHLRSASRRVYALSLVAFSLAVVAKFTAVLLLPMFALLALGRVRWSRAQPGPGAGRATLDGTRATLLAILTSAVAHAGAAWLTIWAFFGFRFSTFHPDLPPGRYTLSWDYLLQGGGVVGAVVTWLRDWHLLPEAFLYGFAFVLKHAEARGAFLDGAYSIHGWVEFFPKALLYKSTPALLLAVLLALSLILLRTRRTSADERWQAVHRAAPLIVLFVVYWAASLSSNLNIGHRHILPTYPVMFIALGALAWVPGRLALTPRARRGLAVACLGLLPAWHITESLRVFPHHLAYFSPVAGGPARGHHHLVDSSLDWGQDLPSLARWLREHRAPDEALHLAYFGTADPAYYGIDAVTLPTLIDLRLRPEWHEPRAGLYAISATMLQQVYMPARGPWTVEWEREYQQLRQFETAFRAASQDPDDSQWIAAWKRYDALRFARLCHYLRLRSPDAVIGYSIHVYRLSADELTDALYGPMSRLVEAMERAAATPGVWPPVYP